MTTRIEAELYDGLAFQGREHGSDKAVVAGLGGLMPERCDSAALAAYLARVEAERWLLLGGGHRIRFEPTQDLRLVVDRSVAFDGNAVRFLARNTRGEILASRLYSRPSPVDGVVTTIDGALTVNVPTRRCGRLLCAALYGVGAAGNAQHKCCNCLVGKTSALLDIASG